MCDTRPITPWPLPAASRVILVGGTFDPVHQGHVLAATRLRAVADPEASLLFVPAAASPFKVGAQTAPPEARTAMLALALRGVPNAAIWTDELDRADRAPQPSYMIDTVRRALAVAFAGTSFRLLIGADQALRFREWKDAKDLFAAAPPLVVLRDPIRDRGTLVERMGAQRVWTAEELARWADAAFDVGDDLPQSSTEVREAVARGGAGAVPEGWLHPAVAEYIRVHGLYAGGGRA